LNYLHKNNFYHLHLHTGNILLADKSNTIKLTELENFVCNLPVKNEQYFNFLIDDLNYDNNNNNTSKKFNSNNNTNLFTDIFKNQFNIFEKIDIISFGRILYEMATGKELKSSFPDEIELNDMDNEISDVLRLVFFRAKNNNRNNNNNNNNNSQHPHFKDCISIKDLLNMKLFNNNNNNDDEENLQNEKDESTFYFFFLIFYTFFR